MTKLRNARPQKRTAGAFKPPPEVAERDDREAFRAHVVEAVSSTWSYTEIREFGARMERDRERLFEILELFEEANDPGRIEAVHFEVHQWRQGERRRTACETRTLDRGKHREQCAKKRARYARMKTEQPELYARTLLQARERCRRWLDRHPRPKQAKLTTEQARDIRSLYQTGLFQVDLALIYGVSASAISLLVKGKTWRGAGGPTVERALRTHRLVPRVRDGAAERKKARTKQAVFRSRRPGYHAAKERERRERDPEAQRAKERARYAARAQEIQAHRRSKLAGETAAEREARLAAHRERCKRYYERKREAVLGRNLVRPLADTPACNDNGTGTRRRAAAR